MKNRASDESDIRTIIVHHDNQKGLTRIVNALLSQGMQPYDILVMDNSPSSPSTLQTIAFLKSKNVRVMTIENRGYANAVNIGIDQEINGQPSPAFTLILTHDVVIDYQSVEEMKKVALETQAAATGPVLRLHDGAPNLWSLGGRHGRVSKLPVHMRKWHSMPSTSFSNNAVECEWLDGACILYRSDSLMQYRMREDYFLYFEEADLHSRMHRDGLKIVCALKATAKQTSSGIPSYLHTRNASIYLRATGHPLRAHFVPWYITLRVWSASVLRRGRVRRRLGPLIMGAGAGAAHADLDPGVRYNNCAELRDKLSIQQLRRGR